MFQFPWSMMHQLNLDWFLEEWKKFRDGFLTAFKTTTTVVAPTQNPSVAVTYDGDANEYTFNFDLPSSARPVQTEIMYASGPDGSTPPAGGWSATPPANPPDGYFTWTRNKVIYNDGYSFTFYAVAYDGLDGYVIRRYTLNVSSGTTSYTISDAAIDEDFALIDFYMNNPRFLESEIVCNSSFGSAVLTLTVSGSSTLTVDLAKVIH